MLVPYRLGRGLGYFQDPLSTLFRWLLTSREVANYTYDLTERNKQYLAAAVAIVTGIDVPAAARYIAELEEDEVLKAHVIRRTREHPRGHIADPAARYGRRAGWYAMVRATKPRVVIETGVDKGLDLFIDDSDHSADYEAREYETILPKLSERAVILADNAHVTDTLYRFAQRTGRRFLFFREEPLRHWYSGAGIGIAY